jgi:hypothetical protein
MRARPDDLVRMRVEGDDHGRQRKVTGELGGPGDNALMAAVHPIEHADGDD